MKPSTRSKNLRSPIRDIVETAKKLKAKGMKIYNFNIGDPNKFDFDTPDYLKEEMIKVMKGKAGHYSDSRGDEKLIESIIKKENEKNQINLTNEDVIVTEGISEGLMFLFGALIEQGRGDEILVPGPTYPPYLEWIKYLGGKPVAYRCIEEKGWIPDVDDLKNKINEKTTTMVIINPNNPTGAVIKKSVLEDMVTIAAENNIQIISDEIYDKLVFGETKYFGVSSLAKDVPVIGVNGFSKVYLVPGWRCGYIFFHDPMNQITELKEAILQTARQRLCACTPIMKACSVAFSGPEDHIKKMNEKLKKRAEFAHKRLNEIEIIDTQKPEGAFYIFPKVKMNGRWKDDEEFCNDVLHNTGLVLPYGSGFGKEYGKDHFRSVILPPIEMMEEAFNKLENFIKNK